MGMVATMIIPMVGTYCRTTFQSTLPTIPAGMCTLASLIGYHAIKSTIEARRQKQKKHRPGTLSESETISLTCKGSGGQPDS
mmetsp:Transcript_64821/g.122939  ORF Transcript_64821/g.122939 Transcript_64821/m.122939 type:complete len:82 (-) Transcript_64821:225-470(-)